VVFSPFHFPDLIAAATSSRFAVDQLFHSPEEKPWCVLM
jgi:hypothetical protein